MKKGYEGKVKNTGAQKVEAVYSQGNKGGKTTVRTGKDLRTGK